MTLAGCRNHDFAMDSFNDIHNDEARLHHMFNTVDDRARATRNTTTNNMEVTNVKVAWGEELIPSQDVSLEHPRCHDQTNRQ